MIVRVPCCQMDGRGSIKELFPTGKQLEALVAPLADGKVAVGQDDLTVVLNEDGVCTQKCALNWTDIPIAMGKDRGNDYVSLGSSHNALPGVTGILGNVVMQFFAVSNARCWFYE